MADTAPPSPQFSRTCPACARKVPNRVSECRCGFKMDTAGSEAPGTTQTPSSIWPWIALGCVATVAAGVLITLQVMPPRRDAAVPSTPAPTGLTDSAIAPEAPVVTSDVPVSPAVPDDSFVTPSLSAPVATQPLAPAVAESSSSASPALEDVVSRSIPAIVSIETGTGRGSGFFAAPRTVVTNRHVVESNVSVTVRLSSGQALPGRVESTSTEYDLALVRVDTAPPSQSVLPLGTANDVRPGQEVIAIGLALGVFQNSVTRGIISAVRRADRTVMLQTDAAINPGNSGGPLLDRQGRVVGINTLKISGTAESLGFAVAVDHARAMLAGGRASGTSLSTSAPVSQPLAPAFSAGSSTDTVRDEGTRRYEQTVEAIARHSAQLDGYWERIKVGCAVRAAPGYDRDWFGLWDGRTSLISPDVSCSSAVKDLENLAAEVRTAMSAAQENARRSSVLPGQLREIRRRYRMDWVGFDR